MLHLAILIVPSAVPSPARAVFTDATPAALTERLLAQAEPPAAAQPAPADERDQVIQKVQELGDPHRQPAEGHRHKRDKSRRPAQWFEEPEIDGKSKAHYLVWGIIDWAIAAQMWAGSVAFAVSAALLAT